MAWSWTGLVAVILALGVSVALVVAVVEGVPTNEAGVLAAGAGGGALLATLAGYVARGDHRDRQ